MQENNSNQYESTLDKFFSSINISIEEKQKINFKQQQIISLIRSNYYKKYCPATSTNFSFELDIKEKTDNRLFFMTRSGIDKEFCNEKDFLIMNNKEELLFKQEQSHKQSAESPIHIQIYNIFENVKCVLHSHSLFSTVLSKIYLKESKISFEGYEIQKGIKGIETHDSKISLPIIENNQNVNYLASQISEIFHNGNNPWGLLLSGHGLYVWGESIEEAKRHLETYEFLLEATYMNKLFMSHIQIN